MPERSERRPPETADLLLVFSELEKHGVDYALLGGAAMAVHGFPRMTRDIDLILPRSARNNARLLKALAALGSKLHFDFLPGKQALDRGFSTAAEGEVAIDVLFVAASKSFEEYRTHIETREIEGVRFRVLDLDGMILSKQTARPQDAADRERLLRLKLRP